MKKLNLKKFALGLSIAASLSLNTNTAKAQGMAVNGTGASADASAMLDVSSTTQGMLVPRMSASQRTSISSPATGLLVYQTDGTAGFYFYNGSSWTSLNSGAPSGSAGGDLTGTYPNPSLANNSVTSAKIVDGTIVNGDINSAAAIAYSKLNLTGNVSIADHSATGTASSTTFLRGDNTWATPAGGAPSGSAGGDLTGTYPNPTLATSGVTSGTYGSATTIPVLDIDSKGRITSASSVTASGGGGGTQTDAYSSTVTLPNSASTYFGPSAGQVVNPSTSGSNSQTRSMIMPFSGTATTILVHLHHRQGTGTNNVGLTVYKNGTATSMVVNLSTSTLGTYYTGSSTSSFTFAAGDRISYVITQSNAAAITVEFFGTLVVTH